MKEALGWRQRGRSKRRFIVATKEGTNILHFISISYSFQPAMNNLYRYCYYFYYYHYFKKVGLRRSCPTGSSGEDAFAAATLDETENERQNSAALFSK